MKRSYIFLLVWLVLVLAVSGCSGEGTADLTTAPVETAEPVTEAQASSVILSEGGKSIYPLIRAETASEELIDLLQQLAADMTDRSGIKVTLGTDWIKRNTVPDSTIPEILFGKTNRPETRSVAQRVGGKGHAVAVEGQKIVVYGSNPAELKKASEAFVTALTKNEAGETVLDLPAGGIIEAGKRSFFQNGDASDYVIVASENSTEAAEALQQAIKNNYGYVLPIKAPTDPETARQILVGDCNRKQSDAVLAEITSSIDYQVKLDGEKLLLVAASQFGIRQAVDYFIGQYLEDEYMAILYVPDDMAHEYSGLPGAEHVELAEGADIRIMSYNVLNENWGDKLPIRGRGEIVASLMMTYLPDVIGMQEVSDGWYTYLESAVKEQYTFVNKNTAEGVTNYSAMAYNKDKVKLITTGCELFSKGNSGNMRLMNWAVFETIGGGERFAVINTHLDINRTDGTPANSYRLVQAKEMGEKVLALQKEYDCPVMITGDYNCNRNTAEYKLFVETGKVKDAQWTSAKAVNNTYKTYHSVGSIAGVGDSSIDHITYTEGVTSHFYMNFVKAPFCNASDHNPIMADLQLN